jgi:rare lipoprotein A
MTQITRALPLTACTLASLLLVACSSSPSRDAGQTHGAHHTPVSTTPAAEAEAGINPSQQASIHSTTRMPRLKPTTTWDGASLPTAWPDQDGPPHPNDVPAEIAAIPDAVPQFEMRSEFGNPDSYQVYGKTYVVLDDATGFKERGRASWYGKKFHGKKTSSGEPYDMFSMTGAHKTLPIPCYARVTNLDTGHSVIIKINDRGPFHDGRVVDVSYAAAVKLDMLGHGSVPVEIEVVTPTLHPAAPTMMAGNLPRPTAVMTATPDAPPQTAASTSRPAPAAVAAVNSPPVTIYSNPPVPVALASAVPASLPAARPSPPPVATSPSINVATASAPQMSTHLSTPHFLQAGLFNDPVNAVGLRDQITSVGIDAANILLRSEEHGSGFAYRVLIGPFEDVSALETVRTRLLAANLPSIPVGE